MRSEAREPGSLGLLAATESSRQQAPFDSVATVKLNEEAASLNATLMSESV